MQNVRIPVMLNPARCAQSGLSYQGVIPARLLKRVNGASAGDCTDVQVSITSGIDIQGIVYLKGKAVTELTLICQRCLEAYQHKVAIEFAYSPVTDDSQIEELPEVYEPLELDDNGEVHLQHLVEDEVLLAFPIVAMHDLADCRRDTLETVVGEIPIEEQENERPNPFAVLQTLKRN